MKGYFHIAYSLLCLCVFTWKVCTKDPFSVSVFDLRIHFESHSLFLSCLMGKFCMGSYVVLHFCLETSNCGKAVKRENKNHQRIGK